MFFYSTNNLSPKVDFKEATLKGQAPDKGLYFPDNIPVLSGEFIKDLKRYSKEDIAFKVILPYIGDSIPEQELKNIISETIAFEFPLIKLNETISSLELFHGPTLAFKDVGARFMSRCLGYFVKNQNKKITVLVATSGDTGGAVANGFYGVEGIEVVILYPTGQVSSIQELQLTTLGKNIKTLEINGSFDDCQEMVKQAFIDKDINNKIFLTSANSINVARWLPQQFYYFFALQQWKNNEKPPVLSVPSGNFGNICAGLLAHCSGLPVRHFIAACNANDVVTNFLETGEYKTKKSVSTMSNAMDVGSPSNFIRILEMFHHQFGDLKKVMSSYSISDKETKTTIKEIFGNYKYLTDPHGAVGYLALKKYLQAHPGNEGIFLETAHPVKFYDVVEPLIEQKINLPDSVKELLKSKKKALLMDAKYEHLKDFLVSR